MTDKNDKLSPPETATGKTVDSSTWFDDMFKKCVRYQKDSFGSHHYFCRRGLWSLSNVRNNEEGLREAKNFFRRYLEKGSYDSMLSNSAID